MEDVARVSRRTRPQLYAFVLPGCFAVWLRCRAVENAREPRIHHHFLPVSPIPNLHSRIRLVTRL